MSLWSDEVMNQLVNDHEMDTDDAYDLIYRLKNWIKYEKENQED
jgi:hypothetical protein